MTFKISSKISSETLVCFYSTKGSSKKVSFCSCTPAEIQKDMQGLKSNETISVSFGEKLFYRGLEGSNTLMMGVGQDGKMDAEKIRVMGAHIYNAAKAEKSDQI